MKKASLVNFCKKHGWKKFTQKGKDNSPNWVDFSKGICKIFINPWGNVTIRFEIVTISSDFNNNLDCMKNLVEEARIICGWLTETTFEKLLKGGK